MSCVESHTIMANSEISQITGMTNFIIRCTVLCTFWIEMRPYKQYNSKFWIF